jgi:dolichol-phosphate mannosyltransferase
LLAWPLTSLSDPMTGFFGLTTATYAAAVANSKHAINASGFKIALELYVKCDVAKNELVEVPFAVRTAICSFFNCLFLVTRVVRQSVAF